ncbi:hypothetical protein C1645_825045 [Glomus cerebriforme]|uniref:Uncharacterized protein n=1 Tax=Glomus cerebriforme TaxID=658196 RepID=A0A397T295_9GLOM|nr:hypothetical protein C1645_825045 [Glomus cerebriforme]
MRSAFITRSTSKILTSSASLKSKVLSSMVNLYELDMLIQICQKNLAKFNIVIRNQERLEAKQEMLETILIEQKGQISEITLRLQLKNLLMKYFMSINNQYSDEYCKTLPYSPLSNNNSMDNMSLDNDILDITNIDDFKRVELSNIGDLY